MIVVTMPDFGNVSPLIAVPCFVLGQVIGYGVVFGAMWLWERR